MGRIGTSGQFAVGGGQYVDCFQLGSCVRSCVPFPVFSLMRIVPRYLLLVFLSMMISLPACRSTTPAGFWSNFHNDLLIKNLSDQGPWGGHRAMHWQSDKQQTFTAKDVLAFASSKGWIFTDSSYFTSLEVKRWVNTGSDVFPLSYDGFHASVSGVNNMKNLDFPRWIYSDCTVFSFKTGWVVYEPGTENSTEVNGFVLLSQDGKEMSVYQLWGE